MLMVLVWAIPLAGSQGKMVNYWMQKCDPALMDVEWDNQEANDDRNICQREQQWRALYLALDIQNASITPNYTRPFLMHCLTNLCSLRVHESIPTQRASSRLTAVHEASAGHAAPVWLHIDTHRHTNTVSTGSSKSKAEHTGNMEHGRQNNVCPHWPNERDPCPSCLSQIALLLVVMWPRFHKLGGVSKSSTLCTERLLS